MIFQKMQEQKVRRSAAKIFDAMQSQWLQHADRYADLGVECDPDALAGEMIMPRLKAPQMAELYQAVKQSLAAEGIPLAVTLENDATVIAWRYTSLEVR